MIKRTRFPRIFFGWWTVLTGMIMNFWGAGYSLWAFSATFKLMASDLGFSRAVTAAATSIKTIEGGFEAPLFGWFTDRFGPRRVMFFGVLLFGLGLILMYFVNSLWAFYLVWGVIVGAGSGASGVAMNTAITNWFIKKRGLAIGMRVMISGTLLLPFLNWLITTQGWRITYVIGGVVMWVILLPPTWLFIRDRRPEYYGLLPDGATMEEGLKEDTGQMIKKGVEYAAEVQEVEFTLRQAMRTPAFWLLIVATIGPSISATAMMIHLIPLLTDMGMSPTRASATVAFVGLFNPVLRFASGLLADRVKKKEHLQLLLGGAYFLQAAGTVLFVRNQTMAMVYPFLILVFVCLAVNMIAMPLIQGRYFGRKAIGSIRGSSAMFTMPLAILAPIYLGWVYDTTGSYITALFVLAILLALSAVFMFLARPPKPPAQITDIHKIV